MLRCDFCCRPDEKPYASYPAEDMDCSAMLGAARHTIRSMSEGGWCACRACYELIEKDDYEALSLRSVSHWPYEESRGEALAFLRQLHLKFREWRTGPAELLE